MRRKSLILVLSFIMLFSWTTIAFADDQVKTPSGIALLEIENFIDDYMVKYIGKASPGAAVVLVKDGDIIFSKGYGYANVEDESPVNSKDTVFEYGSVSKLFVYTTIMRLAEEGKIDLEADIREYLPDRFLKRLKYDEPITMLNIMNHTTGFEDYLFDVVLTSPEYLSSLEQTLKESQPMQVYRPGTITAYSNYAVALASYITEQIFGQDFYKYLMETVFLPLDMNNTSAHPTLEDRPELIDFKATGYYPKGNGNFESGEWSYIPLYPVGSVNGTAEDLARFAIALMPEDGELSPLFDSRGTLDEMLSQSHELGPQLTGFAHGFIEWDGEYRGVGHGGNTAAFSSQINIVPDERFGVIVLTNVASEMDISVGLTEALIGKRDKSIVIGEYDFPDASQLEGNYISARRMHRGFLEFIGYFSLLNVKAVESNKIELSMMGQTSTLIQTSPYIYQRVEANGGIFEHHFDTVYFEVNDGEVKRISGDYLPLSSGRTIPWLIASLIIVIVSLLYFIVSPISLLIGSILRKKRGNIELPQNIRMHRIVTLLVLSGTGIIFNNLLLIGRMLVNNYRSFSEMKIHILLNYPLVILATLLIILVAVNWKGLELSKGRKIFYLVTIAVMIIMISMLISWQFLTIIA